MDGGAGGVCTLLGSVLGVGNSKSGASTPKAVSGLTLLASDPPVQVVQDAGGVAHNRTHVRPLWCVKAGPLVFCYAEEEPPQPSLGRWGVKVCYRPVDEGAADVVKAAVSRPWKYWCCHEVWWWALDVGWAVDGQVGVGVDRHPRKVAGWCGHRRENLTGLHVPGVGPPVVWSPGHVGAAWECVPVVAVEVIAVCAAALVAVEFVADEQVDVTVCGVLVGALGVVGTPAASHPVLTHGRVARLACRPPGGWDRVVVVMA